MPYGKRDEVELLLRDMEAQKHYLKNTDGTGQWIQGQVRVLPFGVYEYVFPKEDMDIVLHTLDFDTNRYNLNKFLFYFVRKFVKYEKIPEYKKDKYYLWVKENVNILPLGIRYDSELLDSITNKTHEAI